MVIVMTIRDQCDRAHAVLTAYRWREDDDQKLSGIITDLFTDLQHLADAYNINIYDCWAKASNRHSQQLKADQVERDQS